MPDDLHVTWARPGPWPVRESVVDGWATADDGRVAVFAQYPARDEPRPLPAVLLCHGLGGSHRSYAGIGAHLASHGYAVLHPQFLDSLALVAPRYGLTGVDGPTWMHDPYARDVLHAMLFDPTHWVSRVNRSHAVLESLAGQQHIPVSIAPDQVVVVGHSFGAYTAQLLLGSRLVGVGLDDECFGHEAVAGGVLMSPQGSGDRGLTPRSWDGLDLPLLVVTATRDGGPRGEGLPWRREAFDAAASRLKHLAIVRDGDHLLGGLPLPERGSDPQVREALAAVTVAFADRVHGDPAAGAWLASGPFGAVLTHEHREGAG